MHVLTNECTFIKENCILEVYYIFKFQHGVISMSLPEKCPYSEFFWSTFSAICTEYGEIQSISPYSVRMRENKDQKNSEYGHFSRSASLERIAVVEPNNSYTLLFFL